MTSLLIAAPVLLTLTLLTSGLAKLGARRGTEDAMTSLRLPLRPFHRSVATLLPVAEVALALVLWVPSAPLQTLVAVAITALMLTYLVIIARALTFEERVECACFGTLASPTVSRTTLARNVLLSMLSLLTVVSALSGLMETALVRQPLTVIGMGASLLLAIVLTALALGGISALEADAAPPPLLRRRPRRRRLRMLRTAPPRPRGPANSSPRRRSCSTTSAPRSRPRCCSRLMLA